MRYRVPAALLWQTFEVLRQCGGGRRECQVIWISSWVEPFTICTVVHPHHRAHGGGFELESGWINGFWLDLAREQQGIRVQVHTHPHEAFHSSIDDEYPILQCAGFLSLVIPDFAQGPIGFERAYLAEMRSDGRWREVVPDSRLEVI
jgi:hypothetical protein